MRLTKNSVVCWLSIVFGLPSTGFAETVVAKDNGNNEYCGWDDRWSCGGSYRDPNLKAMDVVLEDGSKETFHAYVVPDIATFYNKTSGSLQVTETPFRGIMGKFVNLLD